MKEVESSCDSVLEAIEPYLEGDLEAGEAVHLERHVTGCEACRQELAWARRVLSGLRGLPQLTCPPGIEARVPGGLPEDGAPPPSRPVGAPSRWGWLASAAALALALLGGALLWRPTPPPASGPELARAEREVRIALTVLDSIHRRAAVSLRENLLLEEVAGAPARALGRAKDDPGPGGAS